MIRFNYQLSILLLLSIVFQNCKAKSGDHTNHLQQNPQSNITVGAENLEGYLPLIKGKSIALLVNHTSLVGSTHLLDTLLTLGHTVRTVFAPEHGFRGNVSNGETVKNGIDIRSGIPIISLYGKNKKPTSNQLKGIEVVIFDIQDVGARFYTYISSMHYMMEACAENNVKIIILDRPNPLGSIVDGPLLDPEFSSFVGIHPIPTIHGLTVGELAYMIQGEQWIKETGLDLKVIKVKNWKHSTSYSIPVSPSPNLPNDQSIALYPSLCLFEGTSISVGRGTDFPFQVFGSPDLSIEDFQFTPVSKPFASKYPKYENETCFGVDLRSIKPKKELNLDYLLNAYSVYPNKKEFFNSFFDKLAGSDQLRLSIIEHHTKEEIRQSWQADLQEFLSLRKKYLLYQE